MSKPLQILMPERALGLVAEAADRAGCKSSTWARQTLYAALRAQGLDPVTMPDRDAGSLYDSLEGKQRYAWIDGDQIRSVSYQETKPDDDGRTWLPVRHFDSEPFDPVTQWRLAPIFTIEGDHVRCEYPVVPKSLEAI